MSVTGDARARIAEAIALVAGTVRWAAVVAILTPTEVERLSLCAHVAAAVRMISILQSILHVLWNLARHGKRRLFVIHGVGTFKFNRLCLLAQVDILSNFVGDLTLRLLLLTARLRLRKLLLGSPFGIRVTQLSSDLLLASLIVIFRW